MSADDLRKWASWKLTGVANLRDHQSSVFDKIIFDPARPIHTYKYFLKDRPSLLAKYGPFLINIDKYQWPFQKDIPTLKGNASLFAHFMKYLAYLDAYPSGNGPYSSLLMYMASVFRKNNLDPDLIMNYLGIKDWKGRARRLSSYEKSFLTMDVDHSKLIPALPEASTRTARMGVKMLWQMARKVLANRRMKKMGMHVRPSTPPSQSPFSSSSRSAHRKRLEEKNWELSKLINQMNNAVRLIIMDSFGQAPDNFDQALEMHSLFNTLKYVEAGEQSVSLSRIKKDYRRKKTTGPFIPSLPRKRAPPKKRDPDDIPPRKRDPPRKRAPVVVVDDDIPPDPLFSEPVSKPSHSMESVVSTLKQAILGNVDFSDDFAQNILKNPISIGRDAKLIVELDGARRTNATEAGRYAAANEVARLIMNKKSKTKRIITSLTKIRELGLINLPEVAIILGKRTMLNKALFNIGVGQKNIAPTKWTNDSLLNNFVKVAVKVGGLANVADVNQFILHWVQSYIEMLRSPDSPDRAGRKKHATRVTNSFRTTKDWLGDFVGRVTGVFESIPTKSKFNGVMTKFAKFGIGSYSFPPQILDFMNKSKTGEYYPGLSDKTINRLIDTWKTRVSGGKRKRTGKRKRKRTGKRKSTGKRKRTGRIIGSRMRACGDGDMPIPTLIGCIRKDPDPGEDTEFIGVNPLGWLKSAMSSRWKSLRGVKLIGKKKGNDIASSKAQYKFDKSAVTISWTKGEKNSLVLDTYWLKSRVFDVKLTSIDLSIVSPVYKAIRLEFASVNDMARFYSAYYEKQGRDYDDADDKITTRYAMEQSALLMNMVLLPIAYNRGKKSTHGFMLIRNVPITSSSRLALFLTTPTRIISGGTGTFSSPQAKRLDHEWTAVRFRSAGKVVRFFMTTPTYAKFVRLTSQITSAEMIRMSDATGKEVLYGRSIVALTDVGTSILLRDISIPIASIALYDIGIVTNTTRWKRREYRLFFKLSGKYKTLYMKFATDLHLKNFFTMISMNGEVRLAKGSALTRTDFTFPKVCAVNPASGTSFCGRGYLITEVPAITRGSFAGFLFRVPAALVKASMFTLKKNSIAEVLKNFSKIDLYERNVATRLYTTRNAGRRFAETHMNTSIGAPVGIGAPVESHQVRDDPIEAQQVRDDPIEVQPVIDIGAPIEAQQVRDDPIEVQPVIDIGAPIEAQQVRNDPIEVQPVIDIGAPIEAQQVRDDPIEVQPAIEDPVDLDKLSREAKYSFLSVSPDHVDQFADIPQISASIAPAEQFADIPQISASIALGGEEKMKDQSESYLWNAYSDDDESESDTGRKDFFDMFVGSESESE